MSDQDNDKPTKPRNLLRILLFASLAANLLIVGTIGGAFIRRAPYPHNPDAASFTPLRDLGFGAYGRALSHGDRKMIGEALAGRADRLRDNQTDFRQQMRLFLGALRATPFDIAGVEKVFGAQRAGLMERYEIGEQLLLERLGEMTDAERAEFAQRLERSLRRRRD